MSLATWKEEFYQIEANKVSAEDAAEHSLKKWLGVQRKALKRHGLEKAGSVLNYDEKEFFLDAETCALCQHHLNEDLPWPDGCSTCDGMIANGFPCVGYTWHYRADSKMSKLERPYIQAVHDDVKPILKWLRTAVAWRKEQKKASQRATKKTEKTPRPNV